MKKEEHKPDYGECSYIGRARLTNKKVLITGGASGIGKAVAIAFGKEGADVVISFLPGEEDNAAEVISFIEKEGRKAFGIPGDISEEAMCIKLVDEANSLLGGLDVLINNAGYQHFWDSIEDISTESFDRTFKVNVYAPFWITKQALRYMGEGANIINTASIQAVMPSQYLLDYAQTKACNIAFTKSLAKQLVERKIRVNAVAPGPFGTSIGGGEDASPLGQESPMDRKGEPVEIVPVFVTLASDECSFVSGQVWAADGAMAIY